MDVYILGDGEFTKCIPEGEILINGMINGIGLKCAASVIDSFFNIIMAYVQFKSSGAGGIEVIKTKSCRPCFRSSLIGIQVFIIVTIYVQ